MAQPLEVFFKKVILLKTSQQRTPVLEPLFNSEYYENLKCTYFEEHLRMAASENMFMKLIKIKNYSYGVLTSHKVCFNTIFL